MNRLPASGHRLSAKTFQPCRFSLTPLVRVWVLLSSGCANPLLPPTQCSASNDLRWTVNGFTVAGDAQHQIGIDHDLLLRPDSVRIDAALNLRDALLMAVNHANNCDRAADQDRADRNQQSAQASYRLNQPVQAASRLLPEISGGADRDRTGGLLVANQALSQLSYSPIRLSAFGRRLSAIRYRRSLQPDGRSHDLVGLDRLELSTSPLSGVRSSHLSYRPGPAF